MASKSLKLVNWRLKDVPEQVYNSLHLEQLDLSGNRLQSIEVVCNLKKLIVLNLSDNGLVSLTESICNLSTLEQLDLSYNCLESLPNLEKLRCLKKLDLGGNKFKQVPEWIQCLEYLEELYLDSNPFEMVPEWLGDLPNLQVLRVTREHHNNLVDDVYTCQPFVYYTTNIVSSTRLLPKHKKKQIRRKSPIIFNSI